MKRAVIIFGGIFLVIVVVATGITLYNRHQASQYADTAVPYIKATIPELSKWDSELIRGYMAPKVLEETTSENFERIVRFFSKLGPLISLEEPKFTTLYDGEDIEGGKAVVNYTIDAIYENGDAEISMSLLDQGGSFQVYKFNIKSLALVD